MGTIRKKDDSEKNRRFKESLFDLIHGNGDPAVLYLEYEKEELDLLKSKSGKQVAKLRHLQFRRWIKDCIDKDRWLEFINPKTGQLNRSRIAKKIKYSSSAQFHQNPAIKSDLEVLEEILEEIGIIKKTKKISDRKKSKQQLDYKSKVVQTKRINELERANTELKTQLDAYKKENKKLKTSKTQNNIIYEIMLETGRVPQP